MGFNTASGFGSATINNSVNQFSRFMPKKGENAWGGDNTSPSAFGEDDIFGGADSAYGSDAYGGFVHFKLREDYTVSH